MRHITGKDVVVELNPGARLVFFDSISVTPELGIAVTNSQGMPDGWVAGENKAEGEIVTGLAERDQIADLGPSWEEIPPLDILFYGKAGEREEKVEIFGAKFLPPEIKYEGKGGERTMFTLKFLVTSPDFIRVNGKDIAARRKP